MRHQRRGKRYWGGFRRKSHGSHIRTALQELQVSKGIVEEERARAKAALKKNPDSQELQKRLNELGELLRTINGHLNFKKF